jgi:hypothetical protein
MSDDISAGLQAAADYRMVLLKDLNAEPEWLSGDPSTTEDVYWWAGPTPTVFSIDSASPQAPHLGVLTVKTLGGLVKDIDIAREYCAELNAYTSTTRWLLLNDFVNDSTPPIIMVAASTFVVGGVEANFPYKAICYMIEEQITKVTALVTSNFFSVDGDDKNAWAYAFMKPAPSGEIRSRDWSQSCFYFDDNVKPYEDLDTTSLSEAAYSAFNQCKATQLSCDHGDTGAWFGVDSFPNIIFEVPYEHIDWEGIILNGASLGVTGHLTALVEGQVLANPHLGNGMLLTMRIMEEVPDESGEYYVGQLNLAPFTGAYGALHGLGSWNFREGEMTYTLFVPSSWPTLLTEEELRWFFMQQFWNMAREAMLARSILRTQDYFTQENYEFGLAAGENSRGMAYGEAMNLD